MSTLAVRASAVVGLAMVLAASPAAQRERASAPAIHDLLDRYDRGEFAAAVKAGATLPDLAEWKEAFPTAARAWIDQSPSNAARRRLVAAGLALEVARDRYERDAASWTELRHVVEWACTEVAREAQPPPGEQAWQRASVALGQRVIDPWWLGLGPGFGNHLEHAWQRFPHDPRFALASVVIGTRQADTDIEHRQDLLAIEKRLTFTSVGGGVAPGGTAASIAEVRRTDARDPRLESREAIAAFDRLLSNPEVGAEAEAHVGHLYLMLHDWQPALDHALAATRLARDGRVRYLGLLMAGFALDQLRRGDEARATYQQAVDAFPSGQTAMLMLAAQVGSTAIRPMVTTMVQRSLLRLPSGDDPWRLYFYGDYYYWSTHIEQLHEALR
jgi:tetratricopeptide (TPR) repeat protein